MADVFISYCSKDRDWVRGELLTRIEEKGLSAFIDFRDFTRGAPSIKEMARGVEECPKTLLVLTPDYIASEWCDLELIMGKTLSPGNRDLRLLPLLKTPCEKPLFVSALTHIDFTDGADRDLAWRQLFTALGKPPEAEAEEEEKEEPGRGQWFLAHPYPMPPHFTGRAAERALLSDWLAADSAHPLLSIRALGGFGKSALVWHWLTHDLQPAAWARVIWWSFYEGDASFEHFLAESLDYLGAGESDATELPAKEAVRSLLQALQAPGTLLVLDGFERALRAFGGLEAPYQGDEERREENERDCISPLAELFLYNVGTQPQLRAKVLLTTRLRPRIIEARGGDLLAGCREEELAALQPDDAVAFFHARGIRGTRTEIERACAPYGYHPLSLRLLAGLIERDLQQPGDIAAAKRLDVTGDIKQQRHHVLQAAYDRLPPSRQQLLGRIACFRSPVGYEALQALAQGEAPLPAASAGGLDADLHDLIARALLHHDTSERRFDLHPIVRCYAYDRLGASARAAAHGQLRDYFAAVPAPEKVARLEDLTPVIELYHHSLRAGQPDEAFKLYSDRLTNPLYIQLGAYPLIIDLLRGLFTDGEDRPPRLKEEGDRAWTLNELANAYATNGQPLRAVPLFEQVNAIDEKQGHKDNLAISLGNLAYMARLPVGALQSAEANLRRSIDLCREIKDEFWEAVGHRELGRLLAYLGTHGESETELTAALELFENQKNLKGQGVTWAYRALGELLRLRTAPVAISKPESAREPARRALVLADEWASTDYPAERDYVRAHWLLGAAHLVAGNLNEAEHHLHPAIERCRRINLVDDEADILIDLARLGAATGAAEEAGRLAEEARVIAERSGYVLQGADAHLELARLARDRADKGSAREHAEQARRLATCDGPPEYTYKAAYTESSTLLAQLEQ